MVKDDSKNERTSSNLKKKRITQFLVGGSRASSWWNLAQHCGAELLVSSCNSILNRFGLFCSFSCHVVIASLL